MKKDHQAHLFRDPWGGQTNEATDGKPENDVTLAVIAPTKRTTNWRAHARSLE